MPRTREPDTPILTSDVALNDSDKTVALAAGFDHTLQSIWVELITTATVGNRQIELQILDAASDVVAGMTAGAVQAASLTRQYLFAAAVPNLTAFINGNLQNGFPSLLLPDGYSVRVFDSAAIDAAADDMVVHILTVDIII